MAAVATSLQGGRVQQEFGYTIVKQIMDSQKVMAEGLLNMMNSGPAPSLDGTGQIVNIGA